MVVTSAMPKDGWRLFIFYVLLLLLLITFIFWIFSLFLTVFF